MPELAAIWLAGLLIVLALWGSATAWLRLSAAGRRQSVATAELLKVLVVCVGACCLAYSALSLLV